MASPPWQRCRGPGDGLDGSYTCVPHSVRHTPSGAHHVTYTMPADTDIFETLRQELRRGTLILAVLAHLKVERYGYSLRQALAEVGLEIDEGALYPMLRRLEGQGLLTSEWREEDKRKKRFYRLSPEGVAVLARLSAEWRAMNDTLQNLI